MSFRKLTEDNQSLKFAIVASKKGVHKRAVKRNKAKRRLKNALNQCLKSFVVPKGIEIQILFMANRNVIEAPWGVLIEAVTFALQKVLKRCPFMVEERT